MYSGKVNKLTKMTKKPSLVLAKVRKIYFKRLQMLPNFVQTSFGPDLKGLEKRGPQLKVIADLQQTRSPPLAFSFSSDFIPAYQQSLSDAPDLSK